LYVSRVNMIKCTNMDTKNVQKQAKEQADKLKKMADKEAQKVRKAAEDAGKQAEDYIKKNPAKATAISAGVGAALGAMLAFLIRGKRKKTNKK